MQPADIYFIAGEPSGDLHASELAAELLKRGEFRLRGVGGPKMRAAGVELEAESTSWGTIGTSETLVKYLHFTAAKTRLLTSLRARRPDLLVLVDFGGFNVRLARLIRRFPWHQPIMYYFPPSSWDKSEHDRSKLAALTDVVATPFDWSERLLRQDGVNAHFVGHPVLDRIQPVEDRAALRAQMGLPAAEHIIGIMAGSRRLERLLMGPPALGAARLLAAKGSYHFLWSTGPSGNTHGPQIPPEMLDYVTPCDDSRLVLQASDLVFTAFGTATLEAAVALTPMIGIYRGTPGMLAQWLFWRPRTPYYAMPSIILDRPLVPELTVEHCNPREIAATAEELLHDPVALEEIRAGLREVRRRLGTPGAAARAAELAIELLRSVGGAAA